MIYITRTHCHKCDLVLTIVSNKELTKVPTCECGNRLACQPLEFVNATDLNRIIKKGITN